MIFERSLSVQNLTSKPLFKMLHPSIFSYIITWLFLTTYWQLKTWFFRSLYFKQGLMSYYRYNSFYVIMFFQLHFTLLKSFKFSSINKWDFWSYSKRKLELNSKKVVLEWCNRRAAARNSKEMDNSKEKKF